MTEPTLSTAQTPPAVKRGDERPLDSLKTPQATFLGLLARGFWPVATHPGEKRPIGKGWGLIRWNTDNGCRNYKAFPEAGCGLCLGPGRAPGGKSLADLDGDGPQAEESRTKFLGGETVESMGWNSDRGHHDLFAYDWDRLQPILAKLKGFESKEPSQTGVYHLPDLPDLELRFGGFHPDGTVKQVQSVCAPTPGDSGKPREWTGEILANLPEAAYECLTAIAEKAEATSKPQANDSPQGKGAAVPEIIVPPAKHTPESWLRKQMATAYGQIALAPNGQRHAAVLAQGRWLGGYLHLGIGFTESELETQLIRAADEAAPERKHDNPRCVREAIAYGKGAKLKLPERLQQPDGNGGASKAEE
jgi:hypothetical protein